MPRPGEHAAAARKHADTALTKTLTRVDGPPECATCTSDADFFLFEPERVARFVCWEHVSPVSAVVTDGETPDRPLAVPLSPEFA